MKRRKKKNAIILVLLVIFVNITLTACAGKEIEKSNVSYKYNKRLESVVIENNLDDSIYVDFDVLLLDENKEIIYKESYNQKYIGNKEKISVNLEDIIPDYISYDKVKNMDAKIITVYEFSNVKLALLLFIIFVVTIIGAIMAS